MSVSVARLARPHPVAGSADAEAILALEAATQDRPLPLASLLREAGPEVAGRAQGVVVLARPSHDREVGRHAVGAAGVGAAPEPVVGFASARLLADEAHVIRLVVDPGHRRAGVGRLLLDALIAWATEQDAGAVLLEVRAGNSPAQALYASAGFLCEGRRPRYYPDGEDALLLRRRLAQDAGVAPRRD